MIYTYFYNFSIFSLFSDNFFVILGIEFATC